VTAVPDAEYAPPHDPDTIPLDVRIGSGWPLTTVTLNGAAGDRWLLDTGASGTFLIFDYFARRHPEALRDEGRGGNLRSVRLQGVGGDFDTQAYQIADLQLATIRFRDFTGFRVISNQSYAINRDGLIGTRFLHLFTLGLDYGNSRIYLTPNAEGHSLGLR